MSAESRRHKKQGEGPPRQKASGLDEGTKNAPQGNENAQEKKAAQEESASFRCGDPYGFSPRREDGVDYWETITDPVRRKDNAQCDAWKNEVKNILIFAGLFSGVVTAFLVESYKNLQPDPSERMVELLTHIATRLENALNASLPPNPSPVPVQLSFSPSSSAIRVNVFWFLSLVLSLTTVLIGTISLQWLREHQSYPEDFTTEKTFTLLHMRMEILEKWYVGDFFASLPLLLQIAVILFFAGIIDFLQSLGAASVTIPVFLVVVASIGFLISTTALPSFDTLLLTSSKFGVGSTVPGPCPYKSPQARFFGYCLMPIIKKLWSGKDTESSWLPNMWVNTRGLSPKWVDLDLKWMGFRRHYASERAFGQQDSNYPYNTTYCADENIWVGPLYDQIEGIRQVCKAYPFDAVILEAAFHCFAHSISFDRYDGTNAIHPPEWHLKSLVEMLKVPKKSVFSDLLDGGSKDQLLLHDEALLCFIQSTDLERTLRNISAIKMELYFRIYNHYSTSPMTQTSSTQPQMLPLAYSNMGYGSYGYFFECPSFLKEYLIHVEVPYMQSLFEDISQEKINWSIHLLFHPKRLEELVTQYVRSLGTRYVQLLPAIVSLRSVLQRPLEARVADSNETQVLQFFLVANAVLFASEEHRSKGIPREVDDLALAVHNFYNKIFSNLGSPPVVWALKVLEKMTWRTPLAVLKDLRSNWKRIRLTFGLLFESDTRENSFNDDILSEVDESMEAASSADVSRES
ncbi:hypothetical protein NLJ89_g10353 [Agrocybe chaxingu]|uniref:DUF6535 domain-containing protein n=1 Tax=Agrocybe chaxingu TaxID=84603 RepID=A0A9W8JRW5_9AGAR|nr:hypothetical protein NLJ89_g10353 [Agrocybe chaxingu]